MFNFLGFRLIERLHHGGGSSLREVVAALEADMEAMYDMIDRFGGGNATGGGGADGGGGGGGARNRDVANATVIIFLFYFALINIFSILI